MNEQTVKGKWDELKGEIRKTWNKLTEDEVNETKGNVQSLAGIIEQKYGTAKDQISGELKKLFSRYSDTINEKIDDAKSNLKGGSSMTKNQPPTTERWQ